jgi:hypothetical protein
MMLRKKMNKKRIVVCLIIIIAIILPMQIVKAQSTTNWIVSDPNEKVTEVSLDLTAFPAPAWLELASSGLQISKPSEICFPFENGQYKWEGQIRQLVNNTWVKKETTLKKVPDEEGQLMACSNVPTSGTYALFQIYTGPKESFVQPTATPTMAPSVSPTPVVTTESAPAPMPDW